MDYTARILSQNLANGSTDSRPVRAAEHSMFTKLTRGAQILVDADRPDRQISRHEYISLVKRIAVGLQRFGVGDQEGVGLLSENDIYYYVLGDGAVAAGAVFSGIPTFVKQAELATAIEAAGLKWLFVAPEFLHLALATVQGLGLLPTMVLVFDPPGLAPYTGPQASLSKMIDDDGVDEASFRNANEGKDPATREAFRFFTSGSTGSVKAAVISHRASSVRADMVAAFPSSDRPFLLVIGMFHVSGALIHTRACSGDLPVHVTTASDAAAVVDRIQALGVGATMITPRLMDTIAVMLDSENDLRRSLSSLQLVSFVGAPCRQETVDMFRKLLPDRAMMTTGYGATELPGLSSCTIDENWVTGCVGRPPPSTDLKLVDPETLQEVQPGATGEVCARSPGCFSGYYNNAAATEA
ncbi:hypothetical protein LLEC1_03690, partial [Akanthomyces lecanii]